MRRSGAIAGGVACLVLALVLVVLAVDVWRWSDALRTDDVRYRAAADGDLWDTVAFVPLGGTRALLGIDDDLAFRRAVRSLRLSRLDERTNSDTELVLQRADAQARLEAIAEGAGDPARRSRALVLLGVLQLATPATTPEERSTALKAATANLQEAIVLDPNNEEAKYNLERVLRSSRGVQTQRGGPAPDPSGGADSSKGAATGPPGSGY